MNKIALTLSVIALLLSIFVFFKPNSNSDLVYVDINKLIEGYDRTKIEKAKFESRAKLLQSNVDSLVKDWEMDLKIYEKARSSMSKKENELKEELLFTKQEQINNYQLTVQKQIKDEDQKATQTVVNDINDYVKEYGGKHNYKIIFGATGGGNIMYADPASDLTEQILKGLNNEYNGG